MSSLPALPAMGYQPALKEATGRKHGCESWEFQGRVVMLLLKVLTSDGIA